MEVKVWGARGSLPTPLSNNQLRQLQRRLLAEATPADIADDQAIEAYLDRSRHSSTHGGDTSCVTLSWDDQLIILDAGSGMRQLSGDLFSRKVATSTKYHLLLSHFHWDHICGLPFFGPMYVPGVPIMVHSWRDHAEEILAGQMSGAYFPVKWDQLPSRPQVNLVDPQQPYYLADAEISLMPLEHPDGAYGHRIERNGTSVCYITDTEISRNPDQWQAAYADFVAGADIVFVDAMYGLVDYVQHYDFGHSAAFTWIDFFGNTDIGELVLFHHDPLADDAQLNDLEERAIQYRNELAPNATWKLSLAYQDQTWQL